MLSRKKKATKDDPLKSWRTRSRVNQQPQESTHQSVSRHEQEICESLGGHAHIGSGRLSGWKSDGSTEHYQIECKQTGKQSLALKVEWLEKITAEALPSGRIPLVAIRFLNIEDPLTDKDWVLVPATEFNRLQNRLD